MNNVYGQIADICLRNIFYISNHILDQNNWIWKEKKFHI